MTTKITKLTYAGSSKVYSQDDEGLSSVVRKLAQDAARARLNGVTDMTDNSTGTAPDPLKLAAQSGKDVAAFTEAGTASAPKAGFDTAIGKVANAMAVIAEQLNSIYGEVGIPTLTDSTTGTIAVSGTIAALDKTVTAVASGCLDVTTGRARLETIKYNMSVLFGQANRVATAAGVAKLPSDLGLGFDGTETLNAIAATGTAVDGSDNSTISKAVIDAELTAIANNIATIAAFVNAMTGTDTFTGEALQVVAWDA